MLMCLTSQNKTILRCTLVQIYTGSGTRRCLDDSRGRRQHLARHGLFHNRTSNSERRSGHRSRSHVASLNGQLDNWNGRGSGFVMERITRFAISITQYRPLHGSNSSFVPTPKFIANKHCTVNVKNDDELCFVWAVLSALYPAKTNKNNVYSYS